MGVRVDLRLTAVEDWSRGRRRHLRRILTVAGALGRRRPSPSERSLDRYDLAGPLDAEQRIRVAQARLVLAIRATTGHEPQAALRKAGHNVEHWLAVAHHVADLIERTPVTLGRGPAYRVEEAVRDLLGEGDALLAQLRPAALRPDPVNLPGTVPAGVPGADSTQPTGATVHLRSIVTESVQTR